MASRSKTVVSRLMIVASYALLLLLVATIILWLRSYIVRDWVMYGFVEDANVRMRTRWLTQIHGYSNYGALQISRSETIEGSGSDLNPSLGWKYDTRAPIRPRSIIVDPHTLFEWAGIQIYVKDSGFAPAGRYKMVRIPYWIITLFLLPVPGWQVSRELRLWQQFRRFQKGQCVKCGFDLRASSDQCPECGNSIRVTPTNGIIKRLWEIHQRWRSYYPSLDTMLITASLICSAAFCLSASGYLWQFPLPSVIVAACWLIAPILASVFGTAAVLATHNRTVRHHLQMRIAKISLVFALLITALWSWLRTGNETGQ